MPQSPRTWRSRSEYHPIEDLIQEGEDILVQISKEPLGSKGARITSHISIPGRYLVFMPTVDHVGISRRIENEAERLRLKDIISQIKPPACGLIVRTVSEHENIEKLQADLNFLQGTWQRILEKERDRVPPRPSSTKTWICVSGRT